MEWIVPPNIDDILQNEGVLCVVGSGRSGKTCLGHLLAANCKKQVYAMAYPESAIELCPPGWKSVAPDDVFTLSDCLLIVDDAALFASSRNFNSSFQKAWVQFQTIISHKRITILFIIQSMNLLDIGTLRSQRMAVLYKFSDAVNIYFERDEFRRYARISRQLIFKQRKRFPQFHPKGWVFDCSRSCLFHHPLPVHWCDGLSIPYRDYIVEVKP